MRLSDAENAGATPVPTIRLAHERRFALGAVTVDPPGREVERDGVRETLEPRVMQALVLLAKKTGGVVSRNDLITACWDDRIVSENAVNRVMSRIRTLAAGIGAGAFELQTIPKIGYRLVTLDSAPAESASKPVVASATTSRRMIVAGLVAAIGAAGVVGWRHAGSAAPNNAAELYRKGLEAQRQGLAEQNIQAVAFFREAVSANPNDAQAWGALALGYRHLLEAGADDDLEATAASARSAAARALELDPGNADAQVALILIPPYFRNWTSMEAALREALKRFPEHWLLWGNLGRILAETGRWREAVSTYNQAVALDQFLPIARARQASTLWGSGRLEEANLAYARAAERWPAHPAIWFGRFNFLALSGDPAQAIALAQQSRLRPLGVPDGAFRLDIQLASALSAKSEATAQGAAQAIRENVANGIQSVESAVLYLSALDQIDSAFELIAGYYLGPPDPASGRRRPIGRLERRYTDFLFMPPTERLRRDPRFARVTAAIGLDAYWRAARTRPDYSDQPQGRHKITNS
jgi:DNA-binding winged helix-turn-helix (wHTH) protein/tetratricopeptide (TPR) repeat protein